MEKNYLCPICRNRAVLANAIKRKFVCIDCDGVMEYKNHDIPLRCQSCSSSHKTCLRCSNPIQENNNNILPV